MKILPLLKCRNMKQAVGFYTGVLDSSPKEGDSAHGLVLNLVNGDIEIQLTVLASDSLFGLVINIFVDDVDGVVIKYLGRGLDTSGKQV